VQVRIIAKKWKQCTAGRFLEGSTAHLELSHRHGEGIPGKAAFKKRWKCAETKEKLKQFLTVRPHAPNKASVTHSQRLLEVSR